ITDLLHRYKPLTALNRFRALRVFFRWALDDDEIQANPMDRMKQPAIPEETIPVIADDELTRLLKACEGKTFEDRRDAAILRLLIDTGMRREEIAGLSVEDIDMETGVATVMG